MSNVFVSAAYRFCKLLEQVQGDLDGLAERVEENTPNERVEKNQADDLDHSVMPGITGSPVHRQFIGVPG